ncbi:MAG: VanZ family protein [Planctomycetota bacterium]|nr:VanZ family protein [Planctomycetota bacterium]
MRPVTKITIFGVRLGVVVLVAYWLMIFTGTHLPGGSQLGPPGNDKIQHFTAYFLLGAMLCYVTTSPRYLPRFLIIGISAMAYAAFDELTQTFIPGRYPDLSDFIADSTGLWAAIAIYATAKLVDNRMHPPTK